MNKAVFIDRDGTLIEDKGYLGDPEKVVLLEGAGEALRRLREAGYRIVLVTNQSGVARGYYPEDAVGEVHERMCRLLEAEGGQIDAIYYCPYHPKGTVERYAVDSPLRKPSPGMLLEAARDLDIDLKKSWMIGDGFRDVIAGRRAGCRTILLPAMLEASRVEGARDPEAEPDFEATTLAEAVDIVLGVAHPPAKGAS